MYKQATDTGSAMKLPLDQDAWMLVMKTQGVK